MSLFCFFPPFFFPAILFLITYVCLIFILSILLKYLRFKSTCDCSVRIFHNLVTVPLEYLDLFHANWICAVSVLRSPLYKNCTYYASIFSLFLPLAKSAHPYLPTYLPITLIFNASYIAIATYIFSP